LAQRTEVHRSPLSWPLFAIKKIPGVDAEDCRIKNDVMAHFIINQGDAGVTAVVVVGGAG
jgi:hypothetical protein